MLGRRTVQDLVRLGPPQVQVQVVLPGEADAAVGLQRLPGQRDDAVAGERLAARAAAAASATPASSAMAA